LDGGGKLLLSAKVTRHVESAPLADMPHSLIMHVKFDQDPRSSVRLETRSKDGWGFLGWKRKKYKRVEKKILLGEKRSKIKEEEKEE